MLHCSSMLAAACESYFTIVYTYHVTVDTWSIEIVDDYFIRKTYIYIYTQYISVKHVQMLAVFTSNHQLHRYDLLLFFYIRALVCIGHVHYLICVVIHISFHCHFDYSYTANTVGFSVKKNPLHWDTHLPAVRISGDRECPNSNISLKKIKI